MKPTIFLLLIHWSFCVSVANMALADTASKEVYNQEALALHNEFFDVLKSDVSKKEKCKAIYDRVHSNTRKFLIILGRLSHYVDRSNELILQYRGIKNLEDVSDVLWPKLEAMANNHLPKFEYFQYFCHQMKDNPDNIDILNKHREYVSTVYSDRNRLVMKTQLNDTFAYLTWVREGRKWKLFNSSRTPPIRGKLSTSDIESIELFVTNILLIEKFNTLCYRSKKIFLDQNDAKVFLRYKYGDAVHIPHKAMVDAAINDAETHVKETIKIFSQFGDCDKASMKQATFVVSMKMTEREIDTMKAAVEIVIAH